MKEPVVFVGMPRRGEEAHAAAVAGMFACTDGEIAHTVGWAQGSLLTHTFNTLYAKALNLRKSHGVTHFAMIHSDVCPDRFWLDVLMSEMNRVGATLISAVIPQRSMTGLTSTAIDHQPPGEDGVLAEAWWNPKPLTLKECFQQEETWTHPGLLVNTGLMLFDITEPWALDICFEQQDRITWKGDEFAAETIPEDWNLLREVKYFGGTVWATRKVGLYHDTQNCHNRSPWGEQKLNDF